MASMVRSVQEQVPARMRLWCVSCVPIVPTMLLPKRRLCGADAKEEKGGAAKYETYPEVSGLAPAARLAGRERENGCVA